MKEFVTWYAALAADGETMLLTHQRPRKDGNGWYYLALKIGRAHV